MDTIHDLLGYLDRIALDRYHSLPLPALASRAHCVHPSPTVTAHTGTGNLQLQAITADGASGCREEGSHCSRAPREHVLQGHEGL